MLSAMLVPIVVVSTLAVATVASHHRLPPYLAARASALAVGAVAATALPTMWITGLGYVAHAPLIGRWSAWCAGPLAVPPSTGSLLGLPALAVTVVGAGRAVAAMGTYWSLRQRRGGIEIAEHNDVFAFTLPGPGGRVVLSRALYERLTDTERRIVVAHERAHAVHRHDRYLLIGQIASALLPLRPLVRRLQFSLERWADECAVVACGDRTLVARTLGHVALYAADDQPGLAFNGLGVPARVAALLAPPVAEPKRPARLALWAAIGTAALFAAFQLNHLAGMLVAHCP